MIALSQFSRRAFCAFSRTSFWASADMREPRQPSRPISSGPLVSSFDQRLIGKALASGSPDKTFKSRERVVLNIAFVQAEGKLVNIAAKMFRAGVVIDADQAALENRENALNSIGGHVVSDILASAVVDSIVAEARALNAIICASFVGMQGRSDFDMLMNSGLNCFLICALDRRCDRPPVALAHPKNGRLADRAATRLELLVFVFVGLDPADESFIDFDNAAKLLEVRPARFPDAMQHEPSRRLPDADLFRQLQARDALARREKQVHCVNPFVQRNMAAFKYRSSAHREIFLALIATIEAALAFRDPLLKAAYWTARTIRPKVLFQIDARRLLVRKHLEQFEG
jgi:hypothetical protein